MKSPLYWLLYYLSYKFSGAHQKPTSDSKFDPKIAHTNHPLNKLLRNLEKSYYSDLICEQPSDIKLPTIDAKDANPELFNFLSRNKTTPVVIRGLLKDTNAVKNWGPDYFIENYGDSSLLTLKKPKDMKGGAYLSFNDALDFHNLTLKDSINGMLKDEETLYINNLTQIFYDNPELVDDLDLDRAKKIAARVDSKNWLKINLFMGGPGTGSSLHCAVGGNFFFNIHGRKKWVLIDPKYTPFLQTTPSKAFEFAISGHDIENPSEILNKIPKYQVVLEPGDVLFIAPWWFHYVKNMDKFTIGCAVRDHSIYSQSFKNNLMYMLMSPYPVYINPWVIKLVEKFWGRDFLLKRSVSSEKHILNNLTKYQIEDSKP